MTGYTVSTYALTAAHKMWDEQSEALRGARKRLLDAEAAITALGPRVGPAATVYLDTWIDTAKSLADAAQRHADSLEAAATNYATVETYVDDELARLLPWVQRRGTQSGYSGGYAGGYP